MWDLGCPISSGYMPHCSHPFFMNISIEFLTSYSVLSQSLVKPISLARLFINPEFCQLRICNPGLSKLIRNWKRTYSKMCASKHLFKSLRMHLDMDSSKFIQNFSEVFSNYLRNFFKIFTKFFQIFYEIFSKILQSSFKISSEFLQIFPKIISDFYLNSFMFFRSSFKFSPNK